MFPQTFLIQSPLATPSQLLFGRRLHQVPHPLNDPEELEDPTFASDGAKREKVSKHTAVIEKFWNCCRNEYLTSLREFNKGSGHNKEVIKVGDVVIVRDEKPRMQWKLALVEGLIKGRDDLARAAHIKIGNYRTTRPIVKLYSLEACNPDAVNPSRHFDAVTDDTRSTKAMIDGISGNFDTCVGQKKGCH